MKTFNRHINTSVLLMFLFSITLPAIAQDDCSKTGQNEDKTKEQYSLYREFFKQKNYTDAIVHWRFVFNNAPSFRETTHIDGVKMYQKKIKEAKAAKDDVTKKAYIDTLKMIYYTRIKCFGDPSGSKLGRLFYDLYRYQPTEIAENYKLGQEVIKKAGNKAEYFVIQSFMITTEKALQKGIISDDELIDNYFQSIDIIDYNIKNNEKNKAKFESVKDFINNRIMAHISCEQLLPRIKAEYNLKPTDQEIWRKGFNQLSRLRCFDDPLTIELAEKLATIEPSEDIYRVIGFYYQKNKNYTKAIKAFNKVLEFADSDAERGEYLMDIAKMYYAMKDYPSSRTYALKAAAKKPGWGEPYLHIGTLYRGSGKKCGSGTGWDSQVVTWAAIDMYQKAKLIDPSVKTEANKKIADTQKYMPSKSECFFRTLKEGDSYKVNCWINVSTTVRYGPNPE